MGFQCISVIRWLVVLRFIATLTAKVISCRQWCTCVSWLSHTSTNTTFLSKATDDFSHMLLQRWEAKIRRKENLPQPGLNSQPPGHEFDTLTTEPPGWGHLCDSLYQACHHIKLHLVYISCLKPWVEKSFVLILSQTTNFRPSQTDGLCRR